MNAFNFSFIIAACIKNILDKLVFTKILYILERLKKFFIGDNKFFFKIWLILFLLWIPLWIFLWPGIFSYDVISQLEVAVNKQYSNWHSLVHTYCLYGSMLLGRNLFRSDDAGCAICILFQMLIMSAICAYTLKVFAKNNMPVLIQLFTLCFFGFHPINLFLVISVTKDTLFGGFILLLTTLVTDAIYNKTTFFHSLNNNILLLISICGILLLRMNGIFILLILLPVFIISFKTERLKIFCISCVPIIIYFWLFLSCFSIINIEKAKPEEAISVPMQQFARTVLYHENEMPGESVEAFYELFPRDVLSRYQHFCVDYLKFNSFANWSYRYFNKDNYLKNKNKYKKLWIKTGIKYPQEYLKSFLCLNLPFWYPDYKYKHKNHSLNCYLHFLNYFSPASSKQFIVTGRNERRIIIAGYLYSLDIHKDIVKEGLVYDKFFPVTMVLSTGLPFWILLFSFCFCLYRKEKKFILPLTIPLITIITYFFAPTYLVRYNYPIIMCIPIMAAAIATTSQQTENRNAGDNNTLT